MTDEPAVKVNRAELMAKVFDIVSASTNSPADELRAIGEVFVKIADALQDATPEEARSVIRATAILHGVNPRSLP